MQLYKCIIVSRELIILMNFLLHFFEAYQIIRYKFNIDRKSSIIKCIKSRQPRDILEIGVHQGSFAIRMLSQIYPSNLEFTSYTGIDLFSELQTKENHTNEISLWADEKNVVANKLVSKFPKANIHLCQGNSSQMLQSLKGNKYDLIFIDGGHSFNTVESDWNLCQGLLNDNGFLFFDDYTSLKGSLKSGFGIRKVVDGIDKEYWRVKIYNNRDFFKKNWGVLSLRVAKISKLK